MENENIKVVEGYFNGQKMVGDDGEAYYITPNYVSKSRLVEGDGLKLYIQNDGSFIFKQTSPVDRKKIIANYIGQFTAEFEGKKYRIIKESITYYKPIIGDKCVLIIPEMVPSTWAALDNVVRNTDQDKEL